MSGKEEKSESDLEIKQQEQELKKKISRTIIEIKGTRSSSFIGLTQEQINNYKVANSIIYRINEERKKQMNQFGLTLHTKTRWLALLTKQLGDLSREICAFEFSVKDSDFELECRINIEKELIHLISVEISWLEQISHISPIKDDLISKALDNEKNTISIKSIDLKELF